MSRVPILPSSGQLSPSTVCLLSLSLALPGAVGLYTHTYTHSHNYRHIVVFDVSEDGSATGNQAILPRVMKSDQIPCEEPTQQSIISNKMFLLFCK